MLSMDEMYRSLAAINPIAQLEMGRDRPSMLFQEFVDSSASAPLRNYLKNLIDPILRKTYSEIRSPSVGLHQCRSLLQNLLSLRSDHRLLHREALSSDETLVTLERSVKWAKDKDRIARVQNRKIRAQTRLETAMRATSQAKEQADALDKTITNLFFSEEADRLPEIQREVSNLSTMHVEYLKAPPPDDYVRSIRKSGNPGNTVKTTWGAIGEGQRVLSNAERSKSIAAMEDYKRAIDLAFVRSQCAELDANDQLDMAIEACNIDERSTTEAEFALQSHQARIADFSGAYSERISILLNEYASVADALGERSVQLMMDLSAYGINFKPFFAAALLVGDEADEKILSEFSIDLSKAALAFDDLDGRVVHVTRFVPTDLIDNGDSLSCTFEIEASNFEYAWIESIALLGPEPRNCLIGYMAAKTETTVGVDRVVSVVNKFERREIQTFVQRKSSGLQPSVFFGEVCNAPLPITLSLDIEGVKKEYFDIEIFVTIRGLPL